MRAAIYARVSTNNGQDPHMQTRELREYCQRRGWEVAGEYVATMAGTGLRCGEVFGLHVEDLDLSSHRIFVRRSVWRGQEVTVKSRSGNRTVNIEPALA